MTKSLTLQLNVNLTNKSSSFFHTEVQFMLNKFMEDLLTYDEKDIERGELVYSTPASELIISQKTVK